MKKSLLALAVLGAFAGVASAQTNVTIYGRVDVSIANENRGGDSVNRLDGGSTGTANQSGSRLGFKGKEDLGGGLSANFVLESGFSPDTGELGQGGLLFGRQAFVGLAGGFGAINFGRQLSPLYLAVDAIDPFGVGMAGNATRLFANFTASPVTTASGVVTSAKSPDRTNNTINYSTPAMGGFSGQLAYTLGEVAGSNSGSRQIGFSVGYANGPIAAVLAYHNANNPAATNSTKSTLLGGTYDFGVAKAHLGFAVNKDDVKLDTRDILIGATVPFGPSTLLVDYIRKQDRFFSNANANQVALGYIYEMSKRTNLYTSYSRTSNDGAVRYNSDVAGANGRIFNVGLRHKF